MLPKPETCRGCPLYQDGKGFVPDEIIPGARVLVVGQNPGETEEDEGRPYAGKTGAVMEAQFFPRAGLVRGENVSIGNTFRCRWAPDGQRTNDAPPTSLLNEAIAHCSVHDVVPDSVELIVTQGAHAWRKYNGFGKISDWRGFLAPQDVRNSDGASAVGSAGSTDYPWEAEVDGAFTVDIQEALGDVEVNTDMVGSMVNHHGVAHDKRRVLGTLHLADLFRNPRMVLPTKLDWGKIPRFLRGEWPRALPEIKCVHDDFDGFARWFSSDIEYVAVDTEYTYPGKVLLLVGMYAPGGPAWLFDYEAMTPTVREWFGTAYHSLVRRVPVVFQNAFADIPIIERHFGVGYKSYKRIDDTMLSHALLWSELPHDLEFLDSVYGQHEKLKHLGQAWLVKPKGKSPGVPNSAFDLKTYNAGDVISTSWMWRGIRGELASDKGVANLYETNMLPLVPIILDMQKRGIRLNHSRLAQAETLYREKVEVASAIATAYCGFPINLNGPQLLEYLTQVDNVSIKSTKKDAIAEAREKYLLVDQEEELTSDTIFDRVDKGGHPLLEARALFGNARQCLSNYIDAVKAEDGGFLARVYPEFKPWAQANARWSTTNPPLAQLPSDLRDILMPDEGWPWFGWDFDQQELRILAASANDRPLLEAFEKEYDVHTMAACDIFDVPYPPVLIAPFKSADNRDWITTYGWEAGKDDLRRVFAKRFQYRLIYGGDPKGAGSIPGAKTLGLNGKKLVAASQRWLAAHPAIPEFWKTLTKNAVSKGVVRDAYDGRRMLLGDNAKSRTREAFDFPMQATASRMHNYTIIKLVQRLKGAVRFVYSMHDSFMFAVYEKKWDEITGEIKAFVNRPWVLANGMEVSIPGTFKEVRL